MKTYQTTVQMPGMQVYAPWGQMYGAENEALMAAFNSTHLSQFPQLPLSENAPISFSLSTACSVALIFLPLFLHLAISLGTPVHSPTAMCPSLIPSTREQDKGELLLSRVDADIPSLHGQKGEDEK